MDATHDGGTRERPTRPVARGAALLTLIALGCARGARPEERPAEAARAPLDALFPPATRGLRVAAGAEATALGRLVDDFASATGWAVLADGDTRARLDATPAGLDRPQDVPARDVYAFVEALLVQHGYAFSVASARPPRILRVASIEGAAARGARANVLQVEPAELDAWAAEHPAFRLQTVVRVEHLDAREAGNALRALLSDSNLEQAVPVADGHALLLSGFAPWLRRMRDTLAGLDRAQPPTAKEPGA